MKLPNFHRYDPLNQLLTKMGTEMNQDFSINTQWDSIVLNLLKWGEIEGLKLKEMDIDSNGLLEIAGQKIVVYIRDQHIYEDIIPTTSGYKYHFAFCKTLAKFQTQWKSDKYVATKTARFKICFKKFGTPIGEGEYDLWVCKDCLAKINYQNYRTSNSVEKDRIFREFSREKYFQHYDSNVNNYTKYTPESAPKNEYPENWSEISRNIRHKRWNKCEKCGSQTNLEVDHINELKYDVREENLQVLCHYCHSKKHSHMSPFKKY